MAEMAAIIRIGKSEETLIEGSRLSGKKGPSGRPSERWPCPRSFRSTGHAFEHKHEPQRGRSYFLPAAPGNGGATIDHAASVRSKRAVETSIWKS